MCVCFTNTNFLMLTLVLSKVVATFFKIIKIRYAIQVSTVSIFSGTKSLVMIKMLLVLYQEESFAPIVEQKLEIPLIFKQTCLEALVSVKKFKLLLRLKSHRLSASMKPRKAWLNYPLNSIQSFHKAKKITENENCCRLMIDIKQSLQNLKNK